jgi:ribosome-binding factor A
MGSGSGRRGYRVAEKIQSIVARELTRVSDPRYHLVTVSRVDVTPDLKSAKIHWMIHGNQEKRQNAIDAFDEQKSQFRRAIASELGTRIVPEIRFFYDESFDVADRMEALFAKIKGK